MQLIQLRSRPNLFAALACAVCLALGGLVVTDVWAQSAKSSVTAREPVTLNFVNAEIEAVANTLAALNGKQVVVDPRVKGTITLVTKGPVSPTAALTQFLSALRVMGFTMVEVGGLYKVVPEADAKLQGGGVSAGPAPSGGSQILTQIFKLNYESASNLVPVLRPLISPNNTINVNTGTNSLVITDYADNLHRLGRIIAALDVANATEVQVIPIRNVAVTDIAPMILRLLETSTGGASGGGAAGAADAGPRTVVIAEPRSNALIVRASNAARLQLVAKLAENLDTPTLNGPNGAAGNIYVVYLKNADATKLATVLRAALTGTVAATTTTSATPQAGGQGSTVLGSTLQPPSTGGQIQADTATNSLIITASEPQYRQLRAVIEKLDARRAQVYVESLIAEVNMDKAAEFGIQWQGPIGKTGDAVVGLLGTNFGSGGSNIVQLAAQGAAGTVTPGKGLNIGAVNMNNGVYVLGFLARFLEQNGAGNILSTPNLLTLDNEEAKIVIGQNVPFVTGQFTNTGSTGGTVNPFQTIERKDVGLTLRVRPQISENGTVRMAIFQEVSSVQASSLNSSTGLVTNKRSIESNVLVEDGSIVVLGGLLQDEYGDNQEKVPGLAEVPFFGHLFKSESRSRKKTNLMVFLRPVVVRDAQATESLSMERYDLMRSGQQNAQPKPNPILNMNDAPVLPGFTPKPRVVAEPEATPASK